MQQAELAVLILAHANPGVFERLTAALVHPRVAVFCHVDAKADLATFQDRAPPGVTFLQDRFSIAWGGYAMIEAELALFRAARDAGPFGFYALISGDTLPITDCDSLVDWIICRPHTLRATLQTPADNGYARFTRIYLPDLKIGGFRGKPYIDRYVDAEDFPMLRRAMAVESCAMRQTLQYYKGSQWFSVSESYLSAMLDFLEKNPDYEEIFRFTAMPDESFFTTLLRVVDPSPSKSLNLVGVDWTRHPLPYVLRSETDLSLVMDSPAPFYRKFTDEALGLCDKVLSRRRGAVGTEIRSA